MEQPIRRYKEVSHGEQTTNGWKCSLFGMGLDDPAPSVDGSVPKPVRGVPSEMIVRDRIREASVRVFLILEDTMHGLVMECSVREMGPSGGHVM